MKNYLFKNLVIFVLTLIPTFVFSQISFSQCMSNILKDPDTNILRDKVVLFNEEITPLMFSLNRKVTAPERKALEKFIQLSNNCWRQEGFQITGENSKDIYVQLRDGTITIANFSLEILKSRLEVQKYIENSKTEKPEPPQVLNLSCIFESGPVVGTESQFQINETAKTIWANRGAAPSNLNFGPTEINFKQSDLYVVISRNTGRFSVSLNNTTHGGKCEVITQRKF
jgi:hypothetical protein